MRQTLDGSGAVLAATSYDPWGVPQQPLTTPFGFTGELHGQDRVHLRARWYDPGNGTFTARDPFAGFPTQPYSLHPYQYAYSAPTTWTDPTGWCVAYGNDFCAYITTWDQFAAAFPHEYDLPYMPATFAEVGRRTGTSPRAAAELAASYDVVEQEPWRYSREGPRFTEAEAFAVYFLGFSLIRALDTDTGALRREQEDLYRQEALCDGLTDPQLWRLLEVNALLGAALGADEVVGQSGFRGPRGSTVYNDPVFGPRGRGDGSKIGPTIPHGFRNAQGFEQFSRRLTEGLNNAGYSDVQAFFQGSSVTGIKYTTGEPFDVGRISDFDIALASPTLLQKAAQQGVELRSRGTRTAPIKNRQLRALGLSELKQELSQLAGRPVNFMIYESAEVATARSPSLPVR